VATLGFEFPDEVVAKLDKVERKMEYICEVALNAGGEVLEREMQNNLKAQIGKGEDATRSTGQLIASLGVSPVKVDHSGKINVKVGFSENRTDGKTNAMIANIWEYGKSNKGARPWLRRAIRAKGKETQAVMEETFEREIDNV